MSSFACLALSLLVCSSFSSLPFSLQKLSVESTRTETSSSSLYYRRLSYVIDTVCPPSRVKDQYGGPLPNRSSTVLYAILPIFRSLPTLSGGSSGSYARFKF